MRILITGASGLVGRNLVRVLLERGHEIVATSRDLRHSSSALPLITRHVEWDPMAGPAPREAFDGVDSIIHLAGESVVGRWTEAKKARVRDSRVIGTRHLVEGLIDMDGRPDRLVSASAMGFYGDRNDELLREDAGPGADFLATTCVEWESEAAAACDLGLEVAHLRIGLVLDPDGGALGQMLTPFKLGLGGPLGSGRQWWSWIHRDDLARMFVTAVEDRWSGAYNAVAPRPMPQAAFAQILGEVLGRPALIPAPAAGLKLLLGEFSNELLSSKRVDPTRSREAGFDFLYPDLRVALEHLLD